MTFPLFTIYRVDRISEASNSIRRAIPKFVTIPRDSGSPKLFWNLKETLRPLEVGDEGHPKASSPFITSSPQSPWRFLMTTTWLDHGTSMPETVKRWFCHRRSGCEKCEKNTVVRQGSLNGTHFGGDQTMQIYGDFEGFPLNSALFGLVISWPLWKGRWGVDDKLPF